jgi:peptidoglycan hydrolase-like protein with peptidoglycan-binding domain
MIKITKKIQNLLLHIGYDIGDEGIDGNFGYYTIRAIEQFQRKNNLNSDGVWNTETINEAEKLIKKIQLSLNYLGYYIGSSFDGDLGHLTKSGIKKFQKENGLEVDGIATPIFLNELGNKIKNLQFTLNHMGYDCGEV